MKKAMRRGLTLVVTLAMLVTLLVPSSVFRASAASPYMTLTITSYDGFVSGDATLFGRATNSDGTVAKTLSEISAVRLGSAKDYNYYQIALVTTQPDGTYRVTDIDTGYQTDKSDMMIPYGGFAIGINYDNDQTDQMNQVSVGDIVTLNNLDVSAAENATAPVYNLNGSVSFTRADASEKLIYGTNYMVTSADGMDYTFDDNGHGSNRLTVDNSKVSDNEHTFVLYFDTTDIPSDPSLGDHDSWCIQFWMKDAQGNDLNAFTNGNNNSPTSQYDTRLKWTRVYTQNGTVKEDVDQTSEITLPSGATGYLIMNLGTVETQAIGGADLLTEYNWNDNNQKDKTVKIRDVGYVNDAQAFAYAYSNYKQPVKQVPSYYGTNYVVTNADGLDDNLGADGQDVNRLIVNGGQAVDDAHTLAFYFDTTAIPDDSSLGDKDNWGIYLWLKDADGNDLNVYNGSSKYDSTLTRTRIYQQGNTVKTDNDSTPGWIVTLPCNATGYIILNLGTNVSIKDIGGMDIAPEWNWNDNLKNKTVKIRDVGYVNDTDTFVNAYKSFLQGGSSSGGGTPPESTPLYGGSYIVTNSKKVDVTINGNSSNDFALDFTSNSQAPADAQAIGFYFDTTGINETNTNYTDNDSFGAYWHVKVGSSELTGTDALGKKAPYTQVYTWRNQIMNNNGYIDWINGLPVNATGYAIIKMSDLKANSEKVLGHDVTASEITSLYFQLEWGWDSDLFNQKVSFSNFGYVTDVDAFLAAYQNTNVPAYTLGTLKEEKDVTLTAGDVEGNFANLQWNSFPNTYRYLVNVYDQDGKYIRSEQTADTSMSLQGLDFSKDYKIQIAPIDNDQNVLSASNVLSISTLAANKEAYMNGLLDATAGYTASGVTTNGNSATIAWDWIDGVSYYAVDLYTQDGQTLSYVARKEQRTKTGSITFTGLDSTKTYVAQIVSYDPSDSIIFAYEATKPFKVSTTGTGTNGNGTNGNGISGTNGNGEPSPNTGDSASIPVGTVLIMTMSLGAIFISRKKFR